MQSLNLVVVGLDISHAYAFAPLFQEAGIKIYLVEGNIEKAKEYEKKTGAKSFRSIKEVPWPEVGGALVTTIASEHAAAALPFLERGIPVYITKQLAASYPEARRIVEAALQNGAPLLAGSVRRFSPAFRTIAEHLKRGDLGEPVIAHRYEPHSITPGDWQDRIEMSGGFIVNFGVHCVDSLCALLGSEVGSVHCAGGKYLHPDALSEDSCVITVQFKSGAMGIAEVLGAQKPFKATQPTLRVHGTKASLEASVDEGLARHHHGSPVYDPASYDFISGNRDTVAAIIHMMRTKTQPVPYDELLAVSRILAMARLSYDEKRLVQNEEFGT